MLLPVSEYRFCGRRNLSQRYWDFFISNHWN